MVLFSWSSFKKFNYWWFWISETNVLLNLIKNQQLNIDKLYLYVKDPFKPKYQLLVNGREKVGIKKLKSLKAFIEYSQTVDDVYENLEDYSRMKKKTVLIVFDDMKVDMESNKILSSIVTELFLREGKRNISFVFISQTYFKVP